MAYAGDLTREEFDALLDQRGGPAIVVHGGAGTTVDAHPLPYVEGTRLGTVGAVAVDARGRAAV